MKTFVIALGFLAVTASSALACTAKVFGLYFLPGSVTPRDGFQSEMEKVIAAAKRPDMSRLILIGSADRRADDHRLLADRRLSAVSEALIAADVPSDRLDKHLADQEASLRFPGPESLTDPVLSNYVEILPLFRRADGIEVDGCGAEI